jgi:hypothetical protein
MDVETGMWGKDIEWRPPAPLLGRDSERDISLQGLIYGSRIREFSTIDPFLPSRRTFHAESSEAFTSQALAPGLQASEKVAFHNFAPFSTVN